jgi:hypothetical protein
VEHAVKASEVVADQTHDSGDYAIGISIPSLHIRHQLFRRDVDLAFDEQQLGAVRRVDYDARKPRG